MAVICLKLQQARARCRMWHLLNAFELLAEFIFITLVDARVPRWIERQLALTHVRGIAEQLRYASVKLGRLQQAVPDPGGLHLQQGG